MFALYVESHCKDGHVMTSDPIKFVETEADAKAFCGNPEIEEISDQIWNEVKCCAEYGELYHVC